MSEDRTQQRLSNILLVTIDCLRRDDVGVYSDSRSRTPAIDQLATEGFWFENAYATSLNTPLSVPSIITGTLPLSYGGPMPLSSEQQTIAERLPEEYTTFCYQTNPHLTYNAGYHRGFDQYVELFEYEHNYREALHEGIPASIGPLQYRRMESKLREYVLRQIDAVVDRYESKIRLEGGAEIDYDRLDELYEKRETAAEDLRRFLKAELDIRVETSVTKWMRRLLPTGNQEGRRQEHSLKRPVGSANRIVDRVQQDIADGPGSPPYFVWTHFMDCHSPYVPGDTDYWLDEFEDYLPDGSSISRSDVNQQPKEHTEALYSASVRFVDSEIDRLVTNVSRELDSVSLVLTADHGELLGEGGLYGHGYQKGFREPVFSVPLLVRPSEDSTLADVQGSLMGITSHVDLIPSVFDRLTDVDKEGIRRGRDVFEEDRREAIVELSNMSIVSSVDAEYSRSLSESRVWIMAKRWVATFRQRRRRVQDEWCDRTCSRKQVGYHGSTLGNRDVPSIHLPTGKRQSGPRCRYTPDPRLRRVSGDSTRLRQDIVAETRRRGPNGAH